MGDAKKEVEELVRKRAKKINELRTNSSKKLTYEEVVYKFFRDMENVYATAQDQYDYSTLMDLACDAMKQRMQPIDWQCNMRVVVNDAEHWKDLRVTGVEITWSLKYIAKNPDKDKTTFVDVGHMLMDGLPQD
jgi:hypothetical protein